MHDNRNPGDDKVAQLLGALAPGPSDRPETRRALSQFKSRIEFERRHTFTMFGIKMSKKIQRVAAAGIGAAALIGLLAIPQVQALASEFLSTFRVQRFVLVGITPDRMEQIQTAMGKDTEYIKTETLTDGGEPQSVASLDEAGAAAGFTPLRPGDGYGEPNEVVVSGASSQRIRLNTKALRSLFSSLNLDPELIPANANNKPFDISLGSGVVATYGGDSDKIVVVQGPAPTIEVPDGVDVVKLGEAMFQLFGMSPAEAAHMSQSIDWASTLVIPVPTDFTSMREFDLRGTTGLLYDGADVKRHDGDEQGEHSSNATIMWQENGQMYVVTAASAELAQAVAESLH